MAMTMTMTKITMRSLVLALGVSGFLVDQTYHSSVFAPGRRTQRRRSSFDALRMEMEASAEQARGPFEDESAGGVAKEAAAPPSRAKEEEAPMTYEELEMLATPFDEHLPKINTVHLVGRVGNDPAPRYFDDGKVVLNLSLAVRRKYHPLERKVRGIRAGEEETDWFALEMWGRDAEYVAEFVEKGTRLGVTGSLAMDGWIDKTTGEQRRKPKIIVRHTDILESRAEAELRKSNRGNYNRSNDGGGSGRIDDDDDDDDGPTPAGTGGFFN